MWGSSEKKHKEGLEKKRKPRPAGGKYQAEEKKYAGRTERPSRGEENHGGIKQGKGRNSIARKPRREKETHDINRAEDRIGEGEKMVLPKRKNFIKKKRSSKMLPQKRPDSVGTGMGS